MPRGVRRIVGVTKADAAAATKKADDFEAKLNQASSLKGVELESAIKALGNERRILLSISTVRKAKFNDTLTKLTKSVMAWKKEQAAAKAGTIVEELIAAAASAEGTKIVVRTDFSLDGKAAKSIATTVGKKVKDKAFLSFPLMRMLVALWSLPSLPRAGKSTVRHGSPPLPRVMEEREGDRKILPSRPLPVSRRLMAF